MKTHNLGVTRKAYGDGQFGSHGNRRSDTRRPDSERWPELSIRKVPASSVTHGESISRNGKTVWAAYDGERFVCAGATADEARRKYQAVKVGERAQAIRDADGDTAKS
jgi:hypothetical protein